MQNSEHSEVKPLLVGFNDAAALLGLRPQTLRNWCARRTSPVPPRKLGSRTVFVVAEIEAFVTALVEPGASALQVEQPPPRRAGRPRKQGPRVAK